MNLQEAYAILELSPDASQEEAKKKYRELTRKFHPDVNKEEGAEDKFKKINEAYKCVSTGKGTDREDFIPQQHNPFNPFGNAWGRVVPAENISMTTQISFAESVLGCKRELNYSRRSKCHECEGQGEKKVNNGCDKCGGRGQIVGRQGHMIFSQTCDKCWGRSQTVPCVSCSKNGMVDTQTSVSVTIPGGVINGNILRLGGMGNYMGTVMNADQVTDVFLHITVIPSPGLSIQGTDVISILNVSLLEALQGVIKSVNTIEGDKEISVPPLSKNKEEVVLPKLGVNGIGSHRIVLEVAYPEDIHDIINVLNGYKTFDPNDYMDDRDNGES